jgi:hypothetical protein
MALPDYMSDVTKQMRQESVCIRREFSTHHLSAGENREDLVKKFLQSHLPERFGVSSGIIVSPEGAFSNQADLVVVDKFNNSPIYPNYKNKLWPVEAVYALIEVKTNLSPSNLSDAIAKGQRFKKLKRNFCNAGQMQRISDSLFVIWAFESASPSTLKSSILSAFDGVQLSERPDLILVLESVVARSGSYMCLSKFGQKGSDYQVQQHAELKKKRMAIHVPEVEMFDMGENSLLGWHLWFDSWLRQAGPRLSDPLAYLPEVKEFGRVV